MRVRDVLLGAQAAVRTLPVCDHYCGVESRMRKSLRLQTDDIERHGALPGVLAGRYQLAYAASANDLR